MGENGLHAVFAVVWVYFIYISTPLSTVILGQARLQLRACLGTRPAMRALA